MKPVSNNKHGTKQHWVPQLLQKPWANDASMIVFDKLKDRRIAGASPQNFCVARGHLDLPDSLAPGETVDGAFTSFEQEGMPVIENVRSTGKLPQAKRERYALYRLVSALRHASLVEQEQFREFHRNYTLNAEPSVIEFGLENSDERDQAIFAPKVWRAPWIEQEVLKRKHLILRHSPRGDYVLGDNPVVCFNPVAEHPIHNVGLGLKTTEVILPISPYYALHFANPRLRGTGSPADLLPMPKGNYGVIEDGQDSQDAIDVQNFIQMHFAKRHIIVPRLDIAETLRQFLATYPDAKEPPRIAFTQQALMHDN